MKRKRIKITKSKHYLGLAILKSTLIKVVLLFSIGVTLLIGGYIFTGMDNLLSPIPERGTELKIIIPTPPEATGEAKKVGQVDRYWQGKATWYSRQHCLGCSATLTMANGQPLDDSKYTVAFNKLPLGSNVRIMNKENFNVVTAEVTDRHGSGWRGVLIDVSEATMRSLGATGSAQVKVWEVK